MNAHDNQKIFTPGAHKSTRRKIITKKTVTPNPPTGSPRCYTPQMSREAVFALRRLAWALNKPMTKTLNALVLQAARQAAGPHVCKSCKSSKDQCSACLFKAQANEVAEQP